MNKLILLCLFISLFSLKKEVYSQEPDFKFYLAFEDATGAKDTVWAVWDSNATYFPGYDTALGEYPQTFLNNNIFKVYIKYNVTDSGRIRAEPTLGKVNGFNIYAVNYTYPITMRWDSSLFFQNNLPFTINKALLDNEWFFFNWNDASFPQQYNMLLTDSIELPSFNWGSQDHFPILFQISHDPLLSIKEENNLNELFFYPNPTNEKLHITTVSSDIQSYQISLIDITGQTIKTFKTNNNSSVINLESLPNGIYFLKMKREKEVLIEKIIKY